MTFGIFLIVSGIIALLGGGWYGILIILFGISLLMPNDTDGYKKIKKTIIVASSSRKKSTSAVGRGIIGVSIAGPVGMLAGLGAKNEDKTTFQVIYTDGSQKTITVKNNSEEFKKYCKYLSGE